MCFRLQDWNGAQIEGVAGRGLERANSALTQNYVGVALVEDVFGAQYQIVNRGTEPALEKNGKRAAPHFFQERKVMHVASAHLKTVCVFLNHGEIARVHDFSDYGQARFRARFCEKAKPFFA